MKGRPATGAMDFGVFVNRELSRVPNPPAKMIASIHSLPLASARLTSGNRSRGACVISLRPRHLPKRDLRLALGR